MLDRADKIFLSVSTVFALIGFVAVAMSSLEEYAPPAPAPRLVDPAPLIEPATLSGAQWFEQVRGYCNPVDVTTRLSFDAAPETLEGTKYEAACYALAGRIDDARASLLSLPQEEQWRGAGVVFDVGHPAADMGDDLAAGPLMELVVEFWPNHYMALYHAGAAAFERGEHELAEGYLERFLVEYAMEDGWRRSALQMLGEIG